MVNFKVGVGINTWDEPRGIHRILSEPSIFDLDSIIIIEGRYKGRIDEPENDPSIMDKFSSLPKVHYERMDDVKQIKKRNRYWEIAEEQKLDWLIVLDSDQYIVLENDKFRKHLNELWNFEKSRCFPVPTFYPQNLRMFRPRLFKNPSDIRHKQNLTGSISHGSLYPNYGEGQPEIIGSMYHFYKKDRGIYSFVDGLIIHNQKNLRSDFRVVRDEVYYIQTPDR